MISLKTYLGLTRFKLILSFVCANVFNFELNTMKRYIFLLLIFFSGFGLAAQTGSPDLIVGVWKSSTKDLMIKIDKVGSHFQGRIVWLDLSKGSNLALDENNPEERLRRMPLKGNKVIQEISFNSSESVWEGGTFYNHKEGKTYNCQIKLQAVDQIKINKYIQNHQDGIVETWIRQ